MGTGDKVSDENAEENTEDQGMEVEKDGRGRTACFW